MSGVTTIPQRFVVDGYEFDTRDDAEQFAQLNSAARDFDGASQNLAQCIARHLKTADGYAFDTSTLGGTFWRVVEAHVPYLEQVQIHSTDAWVVSVVGDHLEVWLRRLTKEPYQVEPSKLYYRREAAASALVKQLEAHLEDVQAIIAEIRGAEGES